MPFVVSASPVDASVIPLRRVLAAGALAGALDITFALVVHVGFRGVAPIRVLQGVASGLLGRAAFDGGPPVAALGLASHFCIATIWAFIYTTFYQRSSELRALTRSVGGLLITAVVFGMAVWLAMDFIVVPLSRAHTVPVATTLFWVMLVGHPVVIGLPIAAIVRGGHTPGGRGRAAAFS